jgi:hypothetical protein
LCSVGYNMSACIFLDQWQFPARVHPWQLEHPLRHSI